MKTTLVITIMFIANIQISNAGLFDKYKKHKEAKADSHSRDIVRSYFSGTGGIFGMGFGSPRQVDVKYTSGEKTAMKHGKFDAASEILNEVGKKDHKNLIAKYYIRDGRVDKSSRDEWSKEAKAEYLVNYKGHPTSIKPERPILTRNERIMAEKSRREVLIGFLSFAESDEEAKIIVSLLTKTRYLTDDDRSSMANIQEKVHINQNGRFSNMKESNSNQEVGIISKALGRRGIAK